MAHLRKNTIHRVFVRDEGICQICHLPVEGSKWNIDHVIPWSHGGSNFHSNLRLTHEKCNTDRGDELSEQQKLQLLSDQFERQEGNCYLCHQPLKFGAVNKIAVDFRLRVSWTNMALVHRPCRVDYNTRIVVPWMNEQKKRRAECLWKILGYKVAI